MAGKVCATAREALAGLLFDGMSVMAGGVGRDGVPETLIDAIGESGVKDLTLISNNGGQDGFGLGILLAGGQVRRLVCSYVGGHRLVEELHAAGRLELELCPQGTLAERIRAGGAGVPAFYTRTGVGTPVARGREVREFDGALHLLERGLVADLAIVKAGRGDAAGNLAFRGAGANFNPVMATAGSVTVAEVEELVAPGGIGADAVHTPGVHVDRLTVGAVRSAPPAPARPGEARPVGLGWTRAQMAARVAARLGDGEAVNLGVGLPTLVADHLPEGLTVTLQSATSLAPRTAPAGAAYFGSSDGFAMIRGGHVDVAVLGALQVGANGDLANWSSPGGGLNGMGGAMDLVAGVRRVLVVMEHLDRTGAPKLLEACTLPLTGRGVVDTVVTELGVFEVHRGRRPLTLVELAPGVALDEVRARTAAAFEVALRP